MEMERRGIIIQLIHMSTVKTGGAHGKQQTIQNSKTGSKDRPNSESRRTPKGGVISPVLARIRCSGKTIDNVRIDVIVII
jgi:hypothetical protein